MKDLRPQRDPRQLSELRQGAVLRPVDRTDAVRRARRRQRWTVGLLIAGVLALVIAPHLVDASRVSSVADRAAAAAGGPVRLSLTCPAAGGYAGAVNPAPPVVLERAVVCHYAAGSLDVPPVIGPVPQAQLARLTTDLTLHSGRPSRPLPDAASLRQLGRRGETWIVFGVTSLGQRVALTGQRYPVRYVWSGAGPDRVWRPSAAIRQLLAADLPS